MSERDEGARGPIVLDGLEAVRASAGRDLGVSAWHEVPADAVDQFGRATGHHDDASLVPPLMLVSLTNLFLPQMVTVTGVSAGVNYGTGEVRFPAPVPIGARVRARAEITAVDDVAGGVQTTMRITVEAEGADGPAVVVEALSRWLA